MGAYSFRPTLGVDEEGNFADLGLSEANHGLTQSVAEDFGALYAPAGLVWRDYYEETGSKDLFFVDGVHQVVDGAYISALSIVSTILGGDYLPSTSDDLPDDMTAERAQQLQDYVQGVMDDGAAIAASDLDWLM